MDRLLQDVRFTLRTLRKSPGFTLVALLTLALGIGGTTAIFTVVRGVVLDPLPYPNADRLVRFKSPVPGVDAETAWDLSTAQYFHFREHAASIEEIGAFRRTGANVRGSGEPRRANGAIVTASMMRLVGAQAALGRIIDETDDSAGAPLAVVLSYGFWEREFGGDPTVVGRTLEINERPYEVIGVMAAGVQLPGEPGELAALQQPDLWAPYRLDPAGPFSDSHSVLVIGRLAEGVSIERAREEISRLTTTLPEVFPNVYDSSFIQRYGFRTELVPLKEYVVGEMARRLWIVFGAVGLVLLIAAANVTNLFLVRLEGRRHELAVRSALGAGRAAIAQPLFVESLLLAAAGGALALFVALAGVRWLVASAPATLPRLDNIGLDAGVVLFTASTSLVVGVALATFLLARHGREAASGLIGRENRTTTAGRERQRVRSGLVAAQVALALVLLVAAGLLLESFQRLQRVDPGIDPEGAVSMRIHLPPARYDRPEAAWRFYDSMLEQAEAIPQVASAGVGGAIPLSGEYLCYLQGFEDAAVLERLGDSEGTTCADLVLVSPGYFEALGIPLLAGRTLTRADHDSPERGAVVVSRAFAHRFWPGEEPLGKGIRPGGAAPPGEEPRYYRVVGVVGDVAATSLEAPPALAVYYPLTPLPGERAPAPYWSLHLLVRTELADPTVVVPALHAALQELDPTIPIAEVETMRALVDRSLSRASFTMVLLGIAAGVALLLAAIGLYGVVSYLVTRRTAEIGIRMVLGAEPRQVERLVMRGLLAIVALGLAAGIGAALLLTRLMRGMLYGVEPSDPMAYLLASVVLCTVALVAAYLPARRATRVDPMVALRAE